MNKNKINIFASFLNVIVSAIQSLWLLSYVQDIMGVEAYGYIAIVTSIVNMANILTLAFTTFTSRYVTINLHQGKHKKANFYFNSSLFALIILAVLCFLGFTLIAMNSRTLLHVDTVYNPQVQVLILLAGGSFAVNAVSTPFKASVYYSNKIYIMHFIQVGSYLSRIVFALVLYNTNTPLLWYAYAGSFLFDIFSLFIYIILTKRMMPAISIKIKYMKKSATMEIMSSGIWAAINKAGASLLTVVNTYLISMIISVFMTGIYSTITQFVSFIGMLTMSLISCFVPTIYKLYSDDDKKRLWVYVNECTKLLVVVISIIVGGMLVFEKYLLNLMIDEQYMKYSLIIILTLIDIPLNYPANILEQLLITFNRYKISAISQLIAGAVNVILIFVINELIGADIYIIIIVTMVVNICRNFIFLPIYCSLSIAYDLKKYYKKVLIGLPTILVCLILSFFVINLMKPLSWLIFVMEVSLVGILSIILSFSWLFSQNEKRFIKKLFMREG